MKPSAVDTCPADGALAGRVIMLGDSHVRAFSTQAAVVPVFLGPGKSLNFLSDANADTTRSRVEAAVRRSPASSRPVMLFGEAVCRHLLGRGWHLDGAGDVRPDADAVMLREATQLLDLLTDLAERYDPPIDLLPPAPSLRARQTELHRRFNACVRAEGVDGDVRVLDPFVIGDWQQTGPSDWYIDAIHCGDRFAEIALRNFWSKMAWSSHTDGVDLWPVSLADCDWLEPDSLFRCYRLRAAGDGVRWGWWGQLADTIMRRGWAG